MQSFLRSHPWVILVAGAAIQIFTGVPAAWGVFQQSVCEGYSFEQQSAAFAFSCIIAAFGVGCVAGGFLQDKKGPRTAAVCGTVLLAGGFATGAFLPEGMPWVFWLAFSVPVGLGCAFLYPAVMTCAQKWYAQRKGLATGVVGGAVGLSGAVLTLLGRWFIGLWGIRGTFVALAVLMAVLCGAACIVLENPQEEEENAPAAKKQEAPKRAARANKQQAAGSQQANLKGASPKPAGAKQASPKPAGAKQAGQKPTGANQAGPEYTVPRMLRTPQYWLLTAAVCFATPAMLLFSLVIVQMGEDRGLPHAAALACIAVGSVFSAAGRLALPWLSDKWGRRVAYLVAFAALCGLSAAFAFAMQWWVLAVYGFVRHEKRGRALRLCGAGHDGGQPCVSVAGAPL